MILLLYFILTPICFWGQCGVTLDLLRQSFGLRASFCRRNLPITRYGRGGGQSDERNDLVLVEVSSFSNRDYVHKWRGNLNFFGLQTSGWVVDPNVLLILQSKSKSPGAPCCPMEIVNDVYVKNIRFLTLYMLFFKNSCLVRKR